MGILSLLPTVSVGAGMGKMTSLHAFLVLWRGTLSPVYFGVVDINGWVEAGSKGSKVPLVWLCWGPSRF